MPAERTKRNQPTTRPLRAGSTQSIATSDATEALRERLLDHTLRVLLRDGTQRFTMAAVAASANASKETLYRHFGNKAGLFRAALIRSAGLIEPLLEDGLDDSMSSQQRLRCIGLNYLRGCYLPEAVALRRIAIADNDYDLGTMFANEITERTISVVQREFERSGSPTPRADAETFLGMIQGKLFERIMLGADTRDFEERLVAQLDHSLSRWAPLSASPIPTK